MANTILLRLIHLEKCQNYTKSLHIEVDFLLILRADFRQFFPNYLFSPSWLGFVSFSLCVFILFTNFVLLFLCFKQSKTIRLHYTLLQTYPIYLLADILLCLEIFVFILHVGRVCSILPPLEKHDFGCIDCESDQVFLAFWLQ